MMSDNVQESLVGGEMGGTDDDWCAPSVSAADHTDEGTMREFLLHCHCNCTSTEMLYTYGPILSMDGS